MFGYVYKHLQTFYICFQTFHICISNICERKGNYLDMFRKCLWLQRLFLLCFTGVSKVVSKGPCKQKFFFKKYFELDLTHCHKNYETLCFCKATELSCIYKQSSRQDTDLAARTNPSVIWHVYQSIGQPQSKYFVHSKRIIQTGFFLSRNKAPF